MRIAIAFGLALAAQGCADAQSQVEPQTPANAQAADAAPIREPEIEDTFPAVFDAAEERALRPRRVRSISLGFIGDGPIGVEPTRHEEPNWTRPFPCDWTDTCWIAPPCTCPGAPGSVDSNGNPR